MKDSDIKQQHNTDSCADSILCKIQDEKVTPRGRWYFVLKNELFWGIGAISVAIGSCSVAAALFALRSSDFGLYQVTHDSFLEYSLDALPFIWLLSLAVFIFVGYMQVKHTDRGYRYPVYFIIGGSLVLSVAGGIVLHSYGFGERVENEVGRYIPFHRVPNAERERLWINSARGIVAGEVVSVEMGTTSFTVKDFKGRPWIIMAEDLSDFDISLITLNDRIRIIGLPATSSTSTDFTIASTSTLHACIILPWKIEGAMRPPMDIKLVQTSDRIDNATQTAVSIDSLRIRAKENENESERKLPAPRITECKDIRPYQLITKMRAEAQY